MSEEKQGGLGVNPITGLLETHSDPTGSRYLANLVKFENDLQQPGSNQNVTFDQFSDVQRQGRLQAQAQRQAQAQAQPQYQQPIIIQQPQNDDRLRDIQRKLSGVEKDNQNLSDYMKGLLIPRYYGIRPSYSPSAILSVALDDELAKRRLESQTMSKLRDIYGEDAPTKYLERSLARINESNKPYELQSRVKENNILQSEELARRLARRKSRSKSPKKRSKSKSKSKGKSKKK